MAMDQNVIARCSVVIIIFGGVIEDPFHALSTSPAQQSDLHRSEPFVSHRWGYLDIVTCNVEDLFRAMVQRGRDNGINMSMSPVMLARIQATIDQETHGITEHNHRDRGHHHQHRQRQ